MKHFIAKIILFAGFLGSFALASAQQQQSVTANHVGSKVYLELELPRLQADLDTLFERASAGTAALQNLTWADVLQNGSNPGVDVNFSGYSLSGAGHVTTTGTFTGDSLVLNKDASITGRLNVSNVTSLSDSLLVEGVVEFGDSLRVVKAVSIGERLFVTGVTALGDSLNVVGNVGMEAMLEVAGAAVFKSTIDVTGTSTLRDTLYAQAPALLDDSLNVAGNTHMQGDLQVDGAVNFGSTLGVAGATTLSDDLSVSGETTLSDTLHVNAPGLFSDSLYVGGGASFAEDVNITGNSSVGGNSSIGGTLNVTGATTLSDDLTVNGETTLKDTLHVDAPGLFSDSLYVGGGASFADDVTITGNSSVGGNSTVGGTMNVTGATTLSGNLTVAGETTMNDSLHVNAPALFGDSVHVDGNMGISGALEVTSLVINGVTIPAIDDTDALPEGTTNLYYTDARAQAAISGGTGVTVSSGEVSIGQDVSTTSDVTFDQLSVDSIAATGALNLSGRATLGDSLVVASGARISATLYADSLVADGLAISGGVQIQDGNQSAGRVLTSDASGNATWQDAVSPYTAGTGVDVTNNVISIGQAVSTTSDVTFADVVADSLRTAALRITDGNQSAGKVLTSDANGNATWQDAVSPYTAGTGVDVTNNVISIGQAVGTTSDVTFDDVTADSLAMTSALTVGGTATFSDSLFTSKAVVLSDSLIVNDGARMTGTLVVDSLSTPGLAVSSAFKYADGSQGANKVLQSNASGEATWVTLPATNPNNPSVAIFGTIGVAPNAASNSTAYYTQSYIDLPPGVWSVQGTTIIRSDAVNGPFVEYANSAIWVRSSFSTSPDVLDYAPTLGGGMIGGSQVWPAPFGLASGTVVINNTSTTTQRYYWWCGANDVISDNPAATLYGFGGNQFGETSLMAFAVEEADDSAEPAPSTITESGDIVFREPVTMRGINNPITKPTNMITDEISLLDDGTGFCTVDMEYQFTDISGAAGGVGETRIFTLPAGYEFDLNFHSVSTGSNMLSSANGFTYDGMRAALPEGGAGWVTNTGGTWTELAVVPYSATEFRLGMIRASDLGVIGWDYVGANFQMIDPHALKVTFRFKSNKAEGGLARVNISGGTGVTVTTDNEISIGQDVATTADVTFDDVTATNLIGSGLRVTDGNQAAGKVLVSDASGNASWQSFGNGAPMYAQFRGSQAQSFTADNDQDGPQAQEKIWFPVTEINSGGFVHNGYQVTLPQGRVFRIDLNLGWAYVNVDNGWRRFKIYNSITNAELSQTAHIEPGRNTDLAGSGTVSTFIDTSAGAVTIEVRNYTGNGTMILNDAGNGTNYATLTIQTVD